MNKVAAEPIGHKRPKDTPGRQQTMKAYKPVPTVKSAAIIFTVLGVIFIIIGSVLLAFSQEIISYSQRYDNVGNCSTMTWEHPQNCTVSFNVEKDMDSTVYFYYQLNNFYQNHRRYVKSKSASQLDGATPSISGASSDCDPIVTMFDLGITADQLIASGRTVLAESALNKNVVANPCGLIAQSLFNDTYSMTGSSGGVFINENGIAWQSDIDHKFKNNSNSIETQWTDVTNGKGYLEHFIVWMRTSGLPNFRKLWGKIEGGLKKGSYTVTVVSNYPVVDFGGEKFVVISTANALGGDNSFLGIAYIVVGGITLILALAFVIRGYLFKKNDDKYP